MPLRLTLICHGATAATRGAAFPADEPLEERAAAEAAQVRHGLKNIDRAFTSPALRAHQTAAALGLDAREDPALRDLDHGRWAGLALSEIQARETDSLLAAFSDPDAAPHGGETVRDLMARVACWMEGFAGETGHVVAVTHAAVIRAAILTVLEASAGAFWRLDITPLSLTDLRHDGRRWAVRTTGRPLAP